MKRLLIKTLPVLILLLTIGTVNSWTSLHIGNTTIWWGVYGLTLILFVKSKDFFLHKENNKNLFVLYLYIIWIVICFVRGLFVADNYWEWKNLVAAALFLLLPLSIYISTHKEMVQKIISDWVKYALPAFFLFSLFLHTEAIGRYLVPISFLLLFFPVLTNKWKLILIFFTIIVFKADLGARSNIIKFAVPLLLSSMYYMSFFFGSKLLRLIHLILSFLPIVLFVLAISGVFNVFKMNEYIEVDNNNLKDEENEKLMVDTRTLLYIEVLESAIINNYVLLGRTPARGNDSSIFGSTIAKEIGLEKEERFSNEVSMLSIFTWIGLIGVSLYFLVLFKASYLAINKSDNFFMKIMGLYLSFRWCYAWVEDFSRFDLSNFFLWLCIGMCFSKSFRTMSNQEFIIWVKGIFDQRYRKLNLMKYKIIE